MSLTTISIPATGNPKGVIALLHGWGANAADLAGLAPWLDLPDYQFLVPEAPHNHPMPGGKMWYDLQTQEGLPASQQLLKDWLTDLPTTTGLPLEKTILAGFSQGGAMTLDLGVQFPLAGLMVYSGFLHTPLMPSYRPPTLLVHGQQDPVVPIFAAQKAKQQLLAAGIEVTYREFVMGHEISPEVVALSREFVLGLENR